MLSIIDYFAIAICIAQVIESIFLKGYSYNVVIGALDRRYSSIKEIEKRALNKLIVFLGSKEEKNSQINYRYFEIYLI